MHNLNSQECCHRRLLAGNASLRGGADRRPFSEPGVAAQYPPDRRVALRHYALDLVVDLDGQVVTGRALATLESLAQGAQSWAMDAVALEIGSVSLQGAPDRLRWTYDGSKLHMVADPPLASGERVVVVVDYAVRKPPVGLYFIKPSDSEPHKPVQLWSQNQDEDARFWMPVFDSPNAKATFALAATVPTGFVVLSNGALQKVEAKGETTRWEWAIATPHSPYLYTLVVGQFSEAHESVDGLPVQWWVPAGREADGDRAFGRTPEMVRFFSDFTGVPYPYEKYGQVAVADFVFGGMENASMTTQTDRVLVDERAALGYDPEDLVAHELAHQWFGDLVTCRQWSHAWLNEGFATYCESLYREFAFGRDDADWHLYQNLVAYFEEDGNRYRRPVVCKHYREPIELFDHHLYEKGGLVLHMLRGELGDEAFRGSVRTYLERHAYGHAETTDLLRAIEAHTGRSLDAFFDQWIFGAGYPDIKVSYRWDAEANQAVVAVQQTHAADGGAPEAFQFRTTLLFEVDGNEVRHPIEVSRREHTFTVPLASAPVQFGFDPDAWLLAKVELEVPVDLLYRQLEAAPRARGRIQAAQALAKQRIAPAQSKLVQVSQNDPFWAVRAEACKAIARQDLAGAVGHLKAALSDPAARVRRAALAALGSLGRAEAGEVALQHFQNSEPSYHTRAEAALALGKSRHPQAQAILESAVPSEESWNDLVRAALLDALGYCGNKECLPLLVLWTRPSPSEPSRCAAARALGRLGWAEPEVLRALADLAAEGPFRARLAALDALAELGDIRGLEGIDRARASAVDGRIKRKADEARKALLDKSKLPELQAGLRDKVQKLEEETRILRERLDQLEAQLRSGQARPS